MKKFANSEITFGSFSRGDYDAISDKDILIVDEDVRVLKERKIQLEAEGWSVGSYTFEKISHLSNLGALFLQHLKLEGKIIRDDGSRLRSLLKSFVPKSEYSEEILSNFKLIDIASRRPGTAIGSLWASDVLYVSIRNWGIMKLAESDIHVYGYSTVLETLCDLKLIEYSTMKPLLQLRLAKALYRSSESVPLVRAQSWINEAISSLPSLFPAFQFIEVAPEILLEQNSCLPDSAPAYHRLRNTEKTLISALSLMPDILQRSEFKRLKNWISNPRAYSSFAALNEAETRDLFSRFNSELRIQTDRFFALA